MIERFSRVQVVDGRRIGRVWSFREHAAGYRSDRSLRLGRTGMRQDGDFILRVILPGREELAAARTRAEDSERFIRDFIDNLPTLAWTAPPDGGIDYYNQRWYDYTGTTFEQMQGWGWTPVHDPDFVDAVVVRWRASLATGEPFEMEFPLRGANGQLRWFLTRVVPQRDRRGRVVRWFGMNTDIDDIRAARALAEEMAVHSRDAAAKFVALTQDLQDCRARIGALEAENQTLRHRNG